MVVETELAARTWFVTLTVRAEERLRLHYLAEARLDRRAIPDGEREGSRLERSLQLEFQREVQLWLKRLRKKARSRIRYAIVYEQHQDGAYHGHALLHELGQNALRKREIEAEWKLGFSAPRLVSHSSGAAHYLTKYLTKGDGLAFASLKYGRRAYDALEHSEAVAECGYMSLSTEKSEEKGMSSAPRVNDLETLPIEAEVV